MKQEQLTLALTAAAQAECIMSNTTGFNSSREHEERGSVMVKGL